VPDMRSLSGEAQAWKANHDPGLHSSNLFGGHYLDGLGSPVGIRASAGAGGNKRSTNLDPDRDADSYSNGAANGYSHSYGYVYVHTYIHSHSYAYINIHTNIHIHIYTYVHPYIHVYPYLAPHPDSHANPNHLHRATGR